MASLRAPVGANENLLKIWRSRLLEIWIDQKYDDQDDDWHDMNSPHAPHLSTLQSLLVFKTMKDIFYSFKIQRPRKIDIGRHAKYNCGVMLDRVLKYVSDLFCFHCFIALNDSDVIYSAFWHSLENTDIHFPKYYMETLGK